MERPRISIPPDMGDYLLETLAIVIFLAIWIQAMYYWPQLPERIPVHLNGAGQVDGWGSRTSIWFIPGIALLIYAVLSVVQRYPHTYNYLRPVTKENAYSAYQLAIRLIRFLKMACLLLFLIIHWMILRLAIHEESSTSMLPILAGMVVLFGGIGWYLWKSLKQ